MSNDVVRDNVADSGADTGVAGKARDGTATAKSARRGRIANRVLWVVQILVGLDFIFGAYMKLSGMPHMIEMFDDIGAGQWLRYFVGFCELAGGIGLMIPAVASLAAMGLAALMVGALYTNVFILDESLAPLLWLILAVVIAWRRWPLTKKLLFRR
jgi:uncharacterized membrane protein YphA (DoxX/SURF4 family)